MLLGKLDHSTGTRMCPPALPLTHTSPGACGMRTLVPRCLEGAVCGFYLPL